MAVERNDLSLAIIAAGASACPGREAIEGEQREVKSSKSAESARERKRLSLSRTTYVYVDTGCRTVK